MNFTRAAERLNVAQPSLSIQVRRLEEALGFALFDRSNRAIVLTPGGSAFLETARRARTMLEQGIRHAQKVAAGEAGKIAIGYNAAAEFHVIRRVMPAFRQRFPDMRVSFRLLFGNQQFAALRGQEIDVSVSWLPIAENEFCSTPLFDDTFFVCLPAAHALTAKAEIQFSDLSGEPLIMFSREFDHLAYGQVEYSFAQAGSVFNVTHEVDHPLSIISSVAMGYGCGFVSSHVVHQTSLRTVAFRPLVGMNKALGLVWRAESSPIVDRFVEVATDIMTGGSPP